MLHFADHDSNGIDMTRDIRDRLALYARDDIEVRRLALNMDQVRRYRPPPNFVKEKDARTAAYRKQFGTDKCWELDALSPTVIAALIEAELEKIIVPSRWRTAMAQERRGRKQLETIAANWTKVQKFAAKMAKRPAP